MKIVVVGCGKMGLPLAAHAAFRGNHVLGVDADIEVVSAINQGRCHIDEPGVAELVERGVKSGCLEATHDLAKAAAWAEAVIVLVPVKLTKDKKEDLSAIINVTREMAPALQPGVTISYETTLPVGTTRKILLPILESGGLKVEQSLFLVFSPERVKSQKVLAHLNDNPKIVGGAGVRSLEKGIALYKAVLNAATIAMPSLEESEMAKLAGMVYRDVNIALANEIALFCEANGMDAGLIIAAANTDGESNLLQPGIGVGGHCTPVYPYFLLGRTSGSEGNFDLVRDARRINDGQAIKQVVRLEKALGGLENRNVLIMGLAFRPGVAEDYCSPAYLLRDALMEKKANVFLHDPVFSDNFIADRGFKPYSLETGGGIDAAILSTAHAQYLKMDWSTLATRGLAVVLDGRNAVDHDILASCGIGHIAVGRGETT